VKQESEENGYRWEHKEGRKQGKEMKTQDNTMKCP